MADWNRGTTDNTRVETVTPELAAEWIKRNTSNRKLMLAQVDALASSIKRGDWRVTHQGIAFGADGMLYDGQHRLHAIIKSGVAVQVRVTRGLSLETRDAIDTGTTRRAADVLAIADGVYVGTNKRAPVLAAHALVSSLTAKPSGRTDVRHLRDALTDHGDSYDAINKVYGNAHDRLAQAPLIGALCVCHGVYPETTLEFVRLLRDPSGLSRESPVVVLRDYVLLNYRPDSGHARDELAGKTFSALLAFKDGETRKFVKSGSAQTSRVINAWRRKMSREPLPTA